MAIRADASVARRTLLASVLLAAIAAGVVLVLGVIQRATEVQIERNQRAWFLAQLNELVPAAAYDNDLLMDRVSLRAPAALGTNHPQPVYRARRGGHPVAAIFRTVAPDGYGGPIVLMVAIRADGTLVGVSVLAHHETPGLGDAFEPQRSDWLESFVGKSLGDPGPDEWAVRKDGGAFDQFTGATITPRAIVNAVHRTLQYFARQSAEIFDRPSDPASQANR